MPFMDNYAAQMKAEENAASELRRQELYKHFANIMRIKDGVFEERWDLIQPDATKDESNSKLPLFGDMFRAAGSNS